MRVSATKTAPRVERDVWMNSKDIKAYGSGNDYPQKVLEIINSSGTGSTCMDIYIKFVAGGGFTDLALNDTILNTSGERASTLLRKAAKDLKYYNGFAFLIKYDGMGIPIEYYNIPFEHCRIDQKDKKYTGKVAVYHDWTGQTGVRPNDDDIKRIHRYDPTKVIEQMTEVGGPEEYLGQVYYFTADGDFEYPVSPFDAVVTDMLTEESVSTVKHRNAKYNFLPSGILIRKGIKPRTLDDGTIDPNDPYNQEQLDSANDIKRMQGDDNASKIWVVDVDADEEKPEFIDFTAKNFDKQFELTEQTVQQNIASMFRIPPVLRGIDVGAGFGAELVGQAYAFMNSVTGDERAMLETAFMDMLKYYRTQFGQFTVQPLTYLAT